MVLSRFVLPVCFCLLALACGAASVDTIPPVPTAPANNQRNFWEWVEPFMPAINSTMRNIWPPIDAEDHKETTMKIVTQTMDPLRLSLEKVERDVIDIKTTAEETNLRIDNLHSNVSLSFEKQDLKMEKIQLRVDKLSSKLDSKFESQSEKIDKLSSEVDSKFRSLYEKIDIRSSKVDSKFESLSEKIDIRSSKVDSKFESLSEKIDIRSSKVDSKFESLSDKIDSLSDSFKSMKSEISTQIQLTNQQLQLILHMLKANTPASGTSESPLAPPLTNQ